MLLGVLLPLAGECDCGVTTGSRMRRVLGGFFFGGLGKTPKFAYAGRCLVAKSSSSGEDMKEAAVMEMEGRPEEEKLASG